MSRVGKKEITIPEGVKVVVEKDRVQVSGPLGGLEVSLPPRISAEFSDGTLKAVREIEERSVRALHGLMRSLLANAVKGVSEGFEKELDVVGIGYRAEVAGKVINLNVGFSHVVSFPIPDGIEIKVQRAQRKTSNYTMSILIKGRDKQQVGQVAADIRSVRPPDSYKGKGIRYFDEIVRLKVGKKGAV
jgi:large subunit ribosomal protein L6